MGVRRYCEGCGRTVFEDTMNGEFHQCPNLEKCYRCGEEESRERLADSLCDVCAQELGLGVDIQEDEPEPPKEGI